VGAVPLAVAAQEQVAAYNQQVGMRLSWFISEMGPTEYRVLVDLCTPDEPHMKT
jgi:hypothetical protein